MSAIMLKHIAMHLVGLPYVELTKSEHAIAHLLIDSGYLFVDCYYTLQKRCAR